MTAHVLINPSLVPPRVDTRTRELRQRAAESARRGLDFLVEHQVVDVTEANHGRYPFVYCCDRNRAFDYTTNWSTGVCVEVMLAGHRFFSDDAYLVSAQRAISYIVSLQEFNPRRPEMYGALHEETPQTTWMHPRDGSTGAWAMLDFGLATGDDDLIKRAAIFGDWYVKYAMVDGYPLWTCRFSDARQDPHWYGSFHSGTAFFLLKLHDVTGDGRFLTAAEQILDHYNRFHLQPDGSIAVILDRATKQVLDKAPKGDGANLNWELMHAFNDDFGALANLAMYHYRQDTTSRNAAERFLRRMVACQQDDGGFGPEGMSIPSAGGVILTEMMASRRLGLDVVEQSVINRAAAYLIGCQRPSQTPGRGAFLGYTSTYELDGKTANTRSGAYAIMALLRYAGADDGGYYFGGDDAVDATPLNGI